MYILCIFETILQDLHNHLVNFSRIFSIKINYILIYRNFERHLQLHSDLLFKTLFAGEVGEVRCTFSNNYL